MKKNRKSWIDKIITSIKIMAKKIRKFFEKQRKKNPKRFDFFVKLINAVWFFLSTFIVNIAEYTFIFVLVMSFSFGGMLAFQWALMTNTKEREIKEVKEEYKKKIKKSEEQLLIFSHNVAHEIKIQIVNMPHQKKYISRNDMINFLNKSLNSLEDILSCRYGTKVSASIKLCIKGEAMKTYARGQNNIASRGGISAVKKLNKKEINVTDNYAYQSIIDRQLQYFVEGNLKCLTDKCEPNDEFFCEYGKEWEKIFLASIVIPIRYPVRDQESEEYKVCGMICIDSPSIQKEWNNKKDSLAYKTVAFLADSIYNLVENYMKCQE